MGLYIYNPTRCNFKAFYNCMLMFEQIIISRLDMDMLKEVTDVQSGNNWLKIFGSNRSGSSALAFNLANVSIWRIEYTFSIYKVY